MSDEVLDLDAIEQRTAAATDGPWIVEIERTPLNELGRATFPEGIRNLPDGEKVDYSEESVIVTAWVHGQMHSQIRIIMMATSPYFETTHRVHMSPENAAFIAAARTDVPALVARVRQLEAELARNALRDLS